MRVKLVGGRLPLTGGAVGFLFRQRHVLNNSYISLIRSPLLVCYFTAESFLFHLCLPFIFRTTCASLLVPLCSAARWKFLQQQEYKEHWLRTLRGRVDLFSSPSFLRNFSSAPFPASGRKINLISENLVNCSIEYLNFLCIRNLLSSGKLTRNRFQIMISNEIYIGKRRKY